MIREGSFSLQRIPLRRGQKQSQYRMERSNSQGQRLSFPRGGDSSIFWGVGRKQYGGVEPEKLVQAKISNPEPTLRKYLSVRNIMNVRDIEGASPSVAPEKVRNIQRGKQASQKMASSDLLGHYEKLFNLKQLASASNQSNMSSLTKSAIMSNAEQGSPAKRYNPTFVTSFAMQY